MTTSTTLNERDRAVLRAVAAGRCALAGPTLLVDGLCCTDQFLGTRLTDAGLVDATTLAGPARLTASGREALAAARLGCNDRTTSTSGTSAEDR